MTFKSFLAAKAPQLISNFTTNMAEAWMHTRCKFDGGKVINCSQSGSWEYCMGVLLQLNMGHYKTKVIVTTTEEAEDIE